MSPVEVRSLYLREPDVLQHPKQPSVLVTSGLLQELIKIITDSEVVRSEEYRAAAHRLIMLLLAESAPFSNRIPLPDGVDARLDSLCRAVIANPSVEVSFREHVASTPASARTLSGLFSSGLGLSFVVWSRWRVPGRAGRGDVTRPAASRGCVTRLPSPAMRPTIASRRYPSRNPISCGSRFQAMPERSTNTMPVSTA
jgi:hypothetical protein